MKTKKLAQVSPEQLNDYKLIAEENTRLKEAMAAIRFLSHKNEVQYWLNATGTDQERLFDILILAREANWGSKDGNRTAKIVAKHK